MSLEQVDDEIHSQPKPRPRFLSSTTDLRSAHHDASSLLKRTSTPTTPTPRSTTTSFLGWILSGIDVISKPDPDRMVSASNRQSPSLHGKTESKSLPGSYFLTTHDSPISHLNPNGISKSDFLVPHTGLELTPKRRSVSSSSSSFDPSRSNSSHLVPREPHLVNKDQDGCSDYRIGNLSREEEEEEEEEDNDDEDELFTPYPTAPNSRRTSYFATEYCDSPLHQSRATSVTNSPESNQLLLPAPTKLVVPFPTAVRPKPRRTLLLDPLSTQDDSVQSNVEPTCFIISPSNSQLDDNSWINAPVSVNNANRSDLSLNQLATDTDDVPVLADSSIVINYNAMENASIAQPLPLLALTSPEDNKDASPFPYDAKLASSTPFHPNQTSASSLPSTPNQPFMTATSSLYNLNGQSAQLSIDANPNGQQQIESTTTQPTKNPAAANSPQSTTDATPTPLLPIRSRKLSNLFSLKSVKSKRPATASSAPATQAHHDIPPIPPPRNQDPNNTTSTLINFNVSPLPSPPVSRSAFWKFGSRPSSSSRVPTCRPSTASSVIGITSTPSSLFSSSSSASSSPSKPRFIKKLSAPSKIESTIQHVVRPSETFMSISSFGSCSLSGSSCGHEQKPKLKNARSSDCVPSICPISGCPKLGSRKLTPAQVSIPLPKPVKIKHKSKNTTSPEMGKIFLAQEISLLSPKHASQNVEPAQAKSAESIPNRGSVNGRSGPSKASKRALDNQPHVSENEIHSDFAPFSARPSKTRPAAMAAAEDDDVSLARPDHAEPVDADLLQPTTPDTSIRSVVPDNANDLSTPSKKGTASTEKALPWALKFSKDGRYLAAAGTDRIIRIYQVLSSPEERQVEIEQAASALLASHSRNHNGAGITQQQPQSQSQPSICRKSGEQQETSSGLKTSSSNPTLLSNLAPVFKTTPIRSYSGHTNDILDLCWSKNNFLLSCSKDRSAKLWHPSRADCLCTFGMPDIVSSVAFHPKDDRYFISGGLDGKLRLWNISAKKLQTSIEVSGMITAVVFTESGDTACVGTFNGAALFYKCTDTLTYLTSIAVRSKTGKRKAQKITAIQSAPSLISKPDDERIMVTSNDSQIRFYTVRQKQLGPKLTASTYINRTSQIGASLSDDGQYVISGSEDGNVYVWNLPSTNTNTTIAKQTFESPPYHYWTCGSGIITCAVFAPLATTQSILKTATDPLDPSNRIIVSIDSTGILKVWRSDRSGVLLSF